MAIDYLAQAEKYRPQRIEILLVGEAPPPKGKTYFYLPTRLPNNTSMLRNRSLPATVFNHYFGRLPAGEKEYDEFLTELKRSGVFLIDIVDKPIKVRGSKDGL